MRYTRIDDSSKTARNVDDHNMIAIEKLNRIYNNMTTSKTDRKHNHMYTHTCLAMAMYNVLITLGWSVVLSVIRNVS